MKMLITEEKTTSFPDSLTVTQQKRTEPLRDCVRDALRNYFDHLNGHPTQGLYQMVLNEIEGPLMETVMDYTRGNQTQAAAILGISRSTLRKKLAHHGLD